ncbi:MAG: carbohydrate binding family 9 domain-containing protein [Gemmatimonadetes bacterium]|nr:carbohydrate binding family 9 domain-containing protein [Gemmatimonadota bacterium]
MRIAHVTLRAALAVGALLFAVPLGAQGTDPAPLQATRLAPGVRAPSLDGRLNDAAWQSARAIDDLRQREPQEGTAATERTEVRIVYDEHTLYIAVHAFDREPAGIVARILERDRVMETNFDGSPQFGGDDAVAILIDGFHDHRNAVVLATNPNGAEFDAMLTDEGREFNIDWRGIWSVAAARTADGWVAEFAVPFRSLRYRPTGDEWGLNVYRMIRRKNEEVLWRGWTRSGGGFSRVSLAGHLRGLEGLPAPRRSIEVRPYVLAGADRERDEDTDRFTKTPRDGLGGELKAQLTPGLVLDATVNTDFAQVEADNQQVNLTRFSLFFPEKREFFLENAGIFEFGARELFGPPPFLLFFSRQIGISEDGPVPVLGGARITGRAGRQTVGLLSMAADTAFDQPKSAFNVLRLKRDIGGNAYLGAMVTDRRSADAFNTAGGVDFSAWPTQTLNVQGFAARTTTKGPGGDGGAARLAVNVQTGRYGINAAHLRIGEEADAQLGFITRTDIQQSSAMSRWTFRPTVLGLRTINLLNFSDYIARLDGGLQDWRVANAFDVNFNSGASVTVFQRIGETRLDESFDLADSVYVPVGAYDGGVTGFFASTNPARPLTLRANGESESTFGGRMGRMTLTVAGRAGKHLGVSVDAGRNWVRLPNGSFTADLIATRVGAAFTTRLFLNALVQYNSLDRRVASNIRFQYIFRPGSDLYLVYNEERGSLASMSTLQSRGTRLKIAYLRRI